jgi:hypothetical protein
MKNPPEMTLRDWFAGQALAAMPDIKSDGDYSPLAQASNYPTRDAAWAAIAAYRIADAMLAERLKP